MWEQLDYILFIKCRYLLGLGKNVKLRELYKYVGLHVKDEMQQEARMYGIHVGDPRKEPRYAALFAPIVEEEIKKEEADRIVDTIERLMEKRYGKDKSSS